MHAVSHVKDMQMPPWLRYFTVTHLIIGRTTQLVPELETSLFRFFSIATHKKPGLPAVPLSIRPESILNNQHVGQIHENVLIDRRGVCARAFYCIDRVQTLSLEIAR